MVTLLFAGACVFLIWACTAFPTPYKECCIGGVVTFFFADLLFGYWGDAFVALFAGPVTAIIGILYFSKRR
jgi:hypothetical protein